MSDANSTEGGGLEGMWPDGDLVFTVLADRYRV